MPEGRSRDLVAETLGLMEEAVGLGSRPADVPAGTRTVNFVLEKFPDLSCQEMGEAAKMYCTGEINLSADKQSYGTFSQKFVGALLVAYKQHRSAVIMKVRKMPPPEPVIDRDKIKQIRIEFVEALLKTYNKYFQLPAQLFSPGFDNGLNIYYAYLKSIGMTDILIHETRDYIMRASKWKLRIALRESRSHDTAHNRRVTQHINDLLHDEPNEVLKIQRTRIIRSMGMIEIFKIWRFEDLNVDGLKELIYKKDPILHG